MKRGLVYSGALALGLFLLSANTALAKDVDEQKGMDQSTLGTLDETTSEESIRASELIGMSVYNMEGKALGSIHDIVVDADSGQPKYVAISYGGFLGMGDKLYAVPWKAFKAQRIAGTDGLQLVIDVSQEKIKSAKGFDQENWPDFSDRELKKELDLHYGVDGSNEGAKDQPSSKQPGQMNQPGPSR